MNDVPPAPPPMPDRPQAWHQRLLEGPLFLWYVCRRYWHDHCFQSGAALGFNALFAVIPILAVGFAILAAFPVFDTIRAGFQDFIVQYLLPQAGEDFRKLLDEFLVNTRNLTAIGIVALAVTAILLLDTIETVFNRIWRQSQVRPLVARIITYWAILTLTPLLIGGSVALSTLLIDSGEVRRLGLSGLTAMLVRISPLFLVIVAFTIMYVIIPYRRVRIRHALIGATVTALLFQALRWGFTLYVTAFPSYKTLYGTLSVIPIFLLWIYLVWCVVLFGAELVAAFPEWRRRPGAGTAKGSQPSRRLVAALLMLEKLYIARETGKPVRTDTLADCAAEALADADRGAGQVIIDKLFQQKIVGRAEPGGWYLARDPATVKVSELLQSLDLGLDAGGNLGFMRTRWRRRAARLFAAAGEAERATLGVTLDALFAPEPVARPVVHAGTPADAAREIVGAVVPPPPEPEAPTEVPAGLTAPSVPDAPRPDTEKAAG